MTLTYASAFAGIGGFDLGFDQAGMRCTSQIEVDPHCQTVLKRNWPTVPLMGDIHDVTGTDLGNPDILAGGFPCQGVSIGAPQRRGLADNRSGLYFEFVRLLEEHIRLVDEARPRWVVIENVEGLLKSPGQCSAKQPCRACKDAGLTGLGVCGTNRIGWDMSAVVRGLEDVGYGWAYRVVDSRYVGSPQRRRRVVVVGHRGGDPRPAWEVLGDPAGRETPVRAGAERRTPGRSILAPSPVPAGEDTLIWRKSARARASLAKGGYETWVMDGDANTLNNFDGGGVKRQTHLVLQNGRVRTLTFTEWERLQGFPDGWTVGVPDSARFEQLGNAVTVPMAAWLGARLAAVDAALPMISV